MKNLTFIIQGPVLQNDIRTLPAVVTVRNFFPQSPIIVSTWGEMGMVRHLEDNIIVVYNSELPDRVFAGEAWAANFHRQARTVMSAMEFVNTDFACKLRTDCYFTNTSLRSFFDRFVASDKEYLQVEKIVRFPFYNYSCDWFQIGKTSNMRRLWSKLDKELVDLNYYSKFPTHHFDPLSCFFAKYHPEQLVYLAQFGVRYSGRHYKPKMYEYIRQRYYYKEKVLIVGKRNIGLESSKYSNKRLDFFPSFMNFRALFFLKLIVEILIGKLVCFR